MAKPVRTTAQHPSPMRDWNQLRAELVEAGPEWEDLYPHALQKALEGRDYGPLLKMLRAGAPLHPALLPVVAEVIADVQQGKSTGRGLALTAHQDKNVRQLFYMLAQSEPNLPKSVRGVGVVHEAIATMFGVSVDTIKRSLKRTEGI